MARVIGIDLGTTNTVVATMMGSEPVIIKTDEGDKFFPSVLSLTDENTCVIGKHAVRLKAVAPGRTFYAVKRLMGQRYTNISSFAETLSYSVVRNKNDKALISMDGQLFSPEQLSSIILQQAMAYANDYLSDEVTDAVITVPAYFSSDQREATRMAAKEAGLNVLYLLPEPTAAAVAYGLGRTGKNELMAVCDLGGGTFDVSILFARDAMYDVRSTAGDSLLGGNDWDEVIVSWIKTKFQEENGFQLETEDDLILVNRLKDTAERAKCDLTFHEQITVRLPFLASHPDTASQINFEAVLPRHEFEKLSVKLLKRVEKAFNQALTDAKVTVDKLQEVILVGGASRMPMVQNLIKKLAGREPNRNTDPMTAIAEGAAIYAQVLSGGNHDFTVRGVVPLSLGIEIRGGAFKAMIPRNTSMPHEAELIVTPGTENQRAATINVYQGEGQLVCDNRKIGKLRVGDLPQAKQGVVKLRLRMTVDSNGIIQMEAWNELTDETNTVRMSESVMVSDEQVGALIKKAEGSAADAPAQLALIQARKDLDKLRREVSKVFGNVKRQMADAERQPLEQLIAEARLSAMGSSDIEKVRDYHARLEQLLETLTDQQPVKDLVAVG